jgi:hypothetical protein
MRFLKLPLPDQHHAPTRPQMRFSRLRCRGPAPLVAPPRPRPRYAFSNCSAREYAFSNSCVARDQHLDAAPADALSQTLALPRTSTGGTRRLDHAPAGCCSSSCSHGSLFSKLLRCRGFAPPRLARRRNLQALVAGDLDCARRQHDLKTRGAAVAQTLALPRFGTPSAPAPLKRFSRLFVAPAVLYQALATPGFDNTSARSVAAPGACSVHVRGSA